MKNRARIVKATLVLASTDIIMSAYTPYPDMKPNPDFNFHEWNNFVEKLYIRNTGAERLTASESRRHELFKQIGSIRKQINIQAEVYYPDRNTKIVAVTSNQKIAIHIDKLMRAISIEKFM